MRNTKLLKCGLSCAIFTSFLFLTLPNLSLAQTNPCAPKAKKPSQNPCAANPCAVKNPCAANPCAPGGMASPSARAVMVRGEVVRVEPGSGKLILKVDGKQIDLSSSKYLVVREGAKVRALKELKPGAKVAVSYVDSGKDRTAWYIYLTSAASVSNPCAANPCAAINPCAPKQPCATKNPCAANPCAPKAK